MKFKICKKIKMYTITLTKEQFKELKSNKTLTINLEEQKQEKWTPSGGGWNISSTGEVFRPYAYSTTSEKYSEAGMEYESEEEAIKASKAIRSYARQLKWLSENSDGWTANWNNIDQEKWYIYYNNKSTEYSSAPKQLGRTMNTIYMSENNAEKLARLLNEGVVEF